MSLRETSYYLRIFQLLITFLVLLLEFISAVGFKTYYKEEPTHGAYYYYWLTLSFQTLYLLHLIIRFRPQWNGPPLTRVYSDACALFIWLSICLVNTYPASRNLNCNHKSGPSLTRCQIFLTNFSLGWLLFPTFIATLSISIFRWRCNETCCSSSSIPMTSVNHQNTPKPPRPPSYVMQKGVLDGQPVLIFNENNNKRMSLYNHRNSSTPHLRQLSYSNNFAGSTPNLLDASNNARDSDSKSVN